MIHGVLLQNLKCSVACDRLVPRESKTAAALGYMHVYVTLQQRKAEAASKERQKLQQRKAKAASKERQKLQQGKAELQQGKAEVASICMALVYQSRMIDTRIKHHWQDHRTRREARQCSLSCA